MTFLKQHYINIYRCGYHFPPSRSAGDSVLPLIWPSSSGPTDTVALVELSRHSTTQRSRHAVPRCLCPCLRAAHRARRACHAAADADSDACVTCCAPCVQMAEGPMYDAPLAPSGMGAEFINAERAPISSYVGASWEAGDVVYDPLDLCELWKVSANNPDAAFLREAELKHCRLAMLAFAGIIHTSAGFHIPGEIWAVDDWSAALSTVQAKNPAALGQIFAGIGIIEGYTSKGVFGKPESHRGDFLIVAAIYAAVASRGYGTRC
eukprot:6200797-Pleurochrysis_carterae.AAC.1